MNSKQITASLAGAVLAMGLVACGGGNGEDAAGGESENTLADLSGQEIKKRVQEDMKAVTSMSMDGELEQSDGTLGLDLALDEAGNCEGTVSLGGASAEILIVDDQQFLKASEEFWTQTAGPSGSQIVQMLDGKWAKMPSGSAGQLGSMCELDTFLSGITEDDSSADEDKLTKGEVTEVDGTPALELSAEEDDVTTRMWIATGEDNHILRLAREGSESGEFTFADYNEPVDVSAPGEGEFVDLAQMGG